MGHGHNPNVFHPKGIIRMHIRTYLYVRRAGLWPATGGANGGTARARVSMCVLPVVFQELLEVRALFLFGGGCVGAWHSCNVRTARAPHAHRA